MKASKSDFSRDNHNDADLSSLRGQETDVLGRTELARETLRRAAAYARETAPGAWREVPAFKQALTDYRRLERKENAYKSRVAAFSTKFHDPRFMGIADYHYIIAPKGLVGRSSIPSVVLPAPLKEVRKTSGIAANFLRAIARSNTTSMMRSHGVSFVDGAAEFP